MTSLQKKGFLFLVLLQLLSLGAISAKKTYALRTGSVVLLECEPKDPRSLFSGDYVILTYKINNLERWFPLSELERSGGTPQISYPIYVALEKDSSNSFWKPVAFSRELENLSTYPVVISGEVEETDPLKIRYGIEQYYVPQTKGLEIENTRETVSAEIAVTPSGQAILKRVFIGGKQVQFDD
jgi:uncharacterized membrane-anchored protein